MFFFFNDTATTKIYTLSLHDALPILLFVNAVQVIGGRGEYAVIEADNVCFASAIGVQRLHTHRKMIDPVVQPVEDRKSTRLNSSHANISYAVFCLKKKKKI